MLTWGSFYTTVNHGSDDVTADADVSVDTEMKADAADTHVAGDEQSGRSARL